jgi:type I restriction enzyme S subunit
MISGDYTVMECSDATTAAFVECFYKAMDDRKLLSPLYSGLRKRIPKPEFLAVVTPIPPRGEQVAIVRSIEESLSGIERSAERMRHEVRLLAEYRTRLVADVVTGKLDVREAAAQLPEEAAPDTAEDDTDPSADPEAIEEEAAV